VNGDSDVWRWAHRRGEVEVEERGGWMQRNGGLTDWLAGWLADWLTLVGSDC